MHILGQHHYHKRMRAKNDAATETGPKLTRYADRLVYAAGILTPLMTLPQLYNVWITRDASGVSIHSWGFYFLGASAWTIYGIIHKEKPIIFANGSMAVLNFFIVIGVLIFAKLSV
ncbi:MAG: SemiSWEET family transporter [Patescibacteria group bacterium]|nr:SemiSWEET family transporter [Patescibacteria group bacterium]